MEITVTPSTILGVCAIFAVFLIVLGFLIGAMNDEFDEWPWRITQVGIILLVTVFFAGIVMSCLKVNFNQILI